MNGGLPEGFAALEPFAGWALPTERARHEKSRSAAMAEVQAFYDAMLPLLSEALDHLNSFSLGAMPEPQARLLKLCLALVEAAMAVEMFNDADPPYLMPISRFEPVHDGWPRAWTGRAP
jgi:hypothetical protein